MQCSGCFIYDFDANNYYILYTEDGNIDNHVLRLFMNYAALSKQLSEDLDVNFIKLK